MSEPIILYGHPVSQPTRSVIALLRAGSIPYTFKNIDLMRGEQKSPEYLAVNPTGFIPAIDDNGFVLAESGAILAYLAESRGLTGWYPVDPKERARTNFWLAWHHTNSRKMTVSVLRPVIFSNKHADADTYKLAMKSVEFLEGHFERNASFVFLTGAAPTIADLLLAPEFDQMDSSAFGLVDFAGFPRVSAWLKAVSAIPDYNEFAYQPAVAIITALKASRAATAAAPQTEAAAAPPAPGASGTSEHGHHVECLLAHALAPVACRLPGCCCKVRRNSSHNHGVGCGNALRTQRQCCRSVCGGGTARSHPAAWYTTCPPVVLVSLCASPMVGTSPSSSGAVLPVDVRHLQARCLCGLSTR